MKFLFSLGFGSATAIAATLIHQSLPPLGVILAITLTYTGIWWLGRYLRKKRYKFLALAAWIAVIIRAGTFGAGQEILVMGDNAGSSLLFMGFLVGVIAAIKKV